MKFLVGDLVIITVGHKVGYGVGSNVGVAVGTGFACLVGRGLVLGFGLMFGAFVVCVGLEVGLDV